MKQIILIVLIAVFTAVNLMAQNSRKAIHIIDGAYVENFDGSQLAGKTIKSYSVDEETGVHIVFTSDYKKSLEEAGVEIKTILDKTRAITAEPTVFSTKSADILVVNVDGKNGKMDDESTVFIVDGKVVSAVEFKNIDVKGIMSIDVIKHKEDEKFKKFAKENTSTVMIITTKK
ncbi:MAG: hypothetical protein MJZ31_05720 [Bacteroidales bacterium]|nr:hypothetical protein [Bacteroidales bacterium]